MQLNSGPWILAALSAAIFVACATHPEKREIESPEYPPLLPPSTLGGHHDTQQILRAAFGAHDLVLRCVVHASPEQVEVIGVTAVGQRAFSVLWDGHSWKLDAAPEVPAAMRPEFLLSDLELALWPLSALQEAYRTTGWEVSEPGGGIRRLRHNGQLVAQVVYASSDPWTGRYSISNFRYGYALAIENEGALADH
jgi:hypothetical protein